MLLLTLLPLLPLVASYSCPEEEFGFLGGDLVEGGIYGVATWQECGERTMGIPAISSHITLVHRDHL